MHPSLEVINIVIAGDKVDNGREVGVQGVYLRAEITDKAVRIVVETGTGFD